MQCRDCGLSPTNIPNIFVIFPFFFILQSSPLSIDLIQFPKQPHHRNEAIDTLLLSLSLRLEPQESPIPGYLGYRLPSQQPRPSFLTQT